jgi:hypothetical protein
VTAIREVPVASRAKMDLVSVNRFPVNNRWETYGRITSAFTDASSGTGVSDFPRVGTL